MEERILDILRRHMDSFLSGEQLSRSLSISQAALAGYIHKLRQQGYDIQAQPHLGYQLTGLPERLLEPEISWRLQTKVIGQKIFVYDSVDSTNSVAFILAEQGTACGTAVFAEAQSKGRGRLGRSWFSPKSQGLYCSVILRPEIPATKASLLTLMAAVSCAQTIRKIVGLPALIKWPNDIVINERKVCGILTEIQVKDSKLKFVILGIGINVDTQRSKLPSGASSLRGEAGATRLPFLRLRLARELLRQLDQDYLYFQDNENPQNLIVRWRNLSALSGKRVKVSKAQEIIEGQAQDIDEQGALVVRLDNGFKEHVLAAEVVKVR